MKLRQVCLEILNISSRAVRQMLVHAPTNICNGGELKQQIREGI